MQLIWKHAARYHHPLCTNALRPETRPASISGGGCSVCVEPQEVTPGELGCWTCGPVPQLVRLYLPEPLTEKDGSGESRLTTTYTHTGTNLISGGTVISRSHWHSISLWQPAPTQTEFVLEPGRGLWGSVNPGFQPWCGIRIWTDLTVRGQACLADRSLTGNTSRESFVRPVTGYSDGVQFRPLGYSAAGVVTDPLELSITNRLNTDYQYDGFGNDAVWGSNQFTLPPFNQPPATRHPQLTALLESLPPSGNGATRSFCLSATMGYAWHFRFDANTKFCAATLFARAAMALEAETDGPDPLIGRKPHADWPQQPAQNYTYNWGIQDVPKADASGLEFTVPEALRQRPRPLQYPPGQVTGTGVQFPFSYLPASFPQVPRPYGAPPSGSPFGAAIPLNTWSNTIPCGATMPYPLFGGRTTSDLPAGPATFPNVIYVEL